MRLAQVWRYPVKALGGERIQRSTVTHLGLPGDRIVGVVDRSSRHPDRPVSARDLPRLLAFSAVWAEGEALVSGPGLDRAEHRSPAVAEAVSEVCGRRLELVDLPAPCFDDAPLHLVNLASLRQLALELGGEVDPRRFRANLYLEGDDREAGCETGWEGRRLDLGEASLEVVGGCPRCAVTTRDPSRPELAWPALLRHLVRTRGELMGVYARAEEEGAVEEGESVLAPQLA